MRPPVYGTRNGQSAGDPSPGPGIVVVYQRPIEDPYHGGSAHIRGLLSDLAAAFPVVTVAPRLSRNAKPTAYPSHLESVSNIIRAQAEAFRFFFGPRWRENTRGRRLVLLFDFYNSYLPFVWCRLRGVPYFYYVQDIGEDVAFLLAGRAVRGASLLRLLRLPFERVLMRRAASLVAVSEGMRARLAKLFPNHASILVCGMRRVRRPPDPLAVSEWEGRLGPRDHIRLIFVGTLLYPPNQMAVRFLIERLAPTLARLTTPTVILIAGTGSESFAGNVPDNVRVLGPVDDLNSLLYLCHIGLAPMEVGGGISGKVADYLTHGLETVATPIAAEGAPTSERLHVAKLSDLSEVVVHLIEGRDGGLAPGGTRSLEPSVEEAYLSDQGFTDLRESIKERLH